VRFELSFKNGLNPPLNSNEVPSVSLKQNLFAENSTFCFNFHVPCCPFFYFVFDTHLDLHFLESEKT
jgi:hypothetical protein